MEIINIDKDCNLVLPLKKQDIKVYIQNAKVSITDTCIGNKEIYVSNGELEYCFVKNDGDSSNNIIHVSNGKCIVNIIDLENNNGNNVYTLITSNEYDNIEFNVASISKKSSDKEYLIKSQNDVNDTSIKIDCFGIVEDTSKLKYDITSFIKNGAKRSVVNQNSKILLFDKESTGINNPILEIEENDVKANHGSSIGMIDEETLFYLTSRGIEENVARNLVSMGKISYMIEKIKDEKIRNELLERM
ncbi:MAG: SufD family Fe-S cluster assembly protein [Bacilli bacterium]|nr:SufD family Fe-S cluster assembly protein [Bacilli bacterium]